MDKPLYGRCTLEQLRAAGVEDLLRRHWQEVAHFKDIPLDPDWEAYAGAEERGRLRLYVVWMGEELVGYAAYFLAYSPHYKRSLQAVQDVLFVAPEYRGSTVGYRLVRYADDRLRDEGVQVTYQHSKVRKDLDLGPMLKRQGYELVDTIWAKRLDQG